MTLTDLIAPNAVVPALKVNTKKQAIQELAARAAELTGQNEHAILEILLQREKLGSTGVGNGVALPHARLPSLKAPFALLARLRHPIDFDAIDGEPVDIVVLLLIPEAGDGAKGNALACVARALRDAEALRQIRAAPDREALFRAVAQT